MTIICAQIYVAPCYGPFNGPLYCSCKRVLTIHSRNRACSSLSCPYRPLLACQDRKRAASWQPQNTRVAAGTAACAPLPFADVTDVTASKHASMPMSDQQLEPHVQQNDPLGKPDESPDANPAKSIFEVMIDMAQDPALLELFHPYLPRDRRTPAGLKAAMTIKMWRTQLLTGESQIRRSEIMRHVRQAAPQLDQLNQELEELGFYGLVE